MAAASKGGASSPSASSSSSQTGAVDLLLIDFERLEETHQRAKMQKMVGKFEIFHDLTRTVMEQIVAGAAIRHYKAGDVIQREGVRCCCCCYC